MAIGPNLPQSQLQPFFSAGDPTMRAPGFFENAAFPAFASAGLDGTLSILPMEPVFFPTGTGATAPTGQPTSPNSLLGIPLDKNGIPKLSADMQKNYLNEIMSSFMQSSKQLQAGFAAFLGPAAGSK